MIGGWIAGSKLPFEANFAIFAGIAVLAAVAVALIPKPQPEQPVAAEDPDGRNAAIGAR